MISKTTFSGFFEEIFEGNEIILNMLLLDMFAAQSNLKMYRLDRRKCPKEIFQLGT